MKFFLISLQLLFSLSLVAQENGYYIKRASGTFQIDGVIDEPDWKLAEVASNFYEFFPSDSIPAVVQSEVWLSYDDNFLYFAAKMYNKTSDRSYVTPSLRRDYRGEANDGITLVLDPFRDNTNAFIFGVNPFGVQREGLVANGDNFDLAWDNKWFSEAKQWDGYWTVEAAIPFKTIRFKEGAEKWNVNFYRIDSETGERSTWTRIPRNFDIVSLAFMRELIWDKPLQKAGSNVSLIPYVAGVSTRNFENADQTAANTKLQVGGDVKVAVSSGLNLDITINPDFSQVEVDQQVTNLDRFEIFFPERRQFFLENADLFADFGHPIARPFFSRRIGVARDNSTGQNIQNKIPVGIRLSGKLDNNWRVGLLNMQTAKDEEINLPGTNHTVAVVQRKVFARSNIGAIFVNRQVTENSEGKFDLSGDFNRVAGVDYNHASADGKWTGKVFYHQSFSAENQPGQHSHAAWLNYQTPGLRFGYAHTLVGENYSAQNGFVPRNGFFRINPEISYFFYPKSNIVNNHGPNADIEIIWDKQRKTDHSYRLLYRINFQSTARANIAFTERFTYLFRAFDPTNTGGEMLAEGTGYIYSNLSFTYLSDFRKRLGFTLEGNQGQYFNGSRSNIRGDVIYRMQPYGSIGVTFNYNDIELPKPYASAQLLLIGPRFDITMSRSFFFTTFIQYNNQIQNININSRLQWRYKPVSDFFLVYTDNYGVADDDIQSPWLLAKNRALVFKMTYWLNM